jgi:hypothetical protein
MFFAGPEIPLLSLGCFLTNSLMPSGGAKNGDRLWQSFILPLPFFRYNSKRKRAFESRFRDWRCACIMQPIFGFCKRALFLDVHQAQELASCSAPHLLQLLFAGFEETENSRTNFRSVRTKDPRDPHYPAPARSRVPPFKQIQNHNLASTAPMSRVKGQFLDQDMPCHAMPCQGRTEQLPRWRQVARNQDRLELLQLQYYNIQPARQSKAS